MGGDCGGLASLHWSCSKVIGYDATVIRGENVSLVCHLTESNDQLTRIIWQKSTKDMTEEKPFFFISQGDQTDHLNGLGDRVKFIGSFAEKNGTIQLHRLRIQDEGIYTCTFNLVHSWPLATDLRLTVLAPPKSYVKGEEPVVGFVETRLASCFSTDAHPPAEVNWTLGNLGSFLKIETLPSVKNDNGTVTVGSFISGVPLKALNEETVLCKVKHRALKEELQLNYTINIQYPPESVVIVPDGLTEVKGFFCTTDSNPPPAPKDYVWTRMNRSTGFYEGSYFPVANLYSDIKGLYICKASNKYGSASGSLYVHVHTEAFYRAAFWSLVALLLLAALSVAGFFMFRRCREPLGWLGVARHDEGEVDTGQERETSDQPRVIRKGL
ncbi:hypothetical protein DNTS_007629 [Danionella cerebrum]|uniref:Ig-like domain-containing protein n=1 Tax=Danionella cerebrum TaxID=2873325 RepID=A0A553QQ02_9TELE|nr:hypothetical protein DNTS_007629 [Danionella translucida]